MRPIYLLFTFLFLSLTVTAQDKIYLVDSSVIEAKVKSVSQTSVTYGYYGQSKPDQIISTSTIIKIVYANGSADFFNAATKKRERQYTSQYGRHMVTFMSAYTAEFVNHTMSDPGIGVCYEYLVDKPGHLGLVLPVIVGFASDEDYRNDYFHIYSGGEIKGNGYSWWMVAPGFKYYPDLYSQKIRYALGVSFYAISGTESYAAYDYYRSLYDSTRNWHYSMAGCLLSNSANISFTKHFYMELGGNIGAVFSDNRRRNTATLDNFKAPILQFYLKAGFRF